MLPRTVTSVQIVMTFGTSPIHRIWKIKISLLSCDSDYLDISIVYLPNNL